MTKSKRLGGLVPAAMLAACGGDTSGEDHVLCHCLFGVIEYTADVCTIDDTSADSPDYEGSRVHRACVSACGETLGPLFLFGSSPRHGVLADTSCSAGVSASSDPLLGADGPDTTNYRFVPSGSRAVLRREGAFGFVDLTNVDLSIDAPRGMDDGVAGQPVVIKKVLLQGDFPVTFDGHTLRHLLFSLGDGFIRSTTNGRVGVDHWQQVNGVTIPAGQTILFSAEIDGVMRHITTTTTTTQSLRVLRYGSPGAYWRRVHYTATIPVPQTEYEVFLDLYFDPPPVPVTEVNAVIPTYVSSTTTRLTTDVVGADRFHWFHPFSGKVVSNEKAPTFDMTKLKADCVVLVAENSATRFVQDQVVCLSKQGCSKACQSVVAAHPAACADGTVEDQLGLMAGCAGSELYADAVSLCGPRSHVCSATEWVAFSNGRAPSHNYWTSDPLRYFGTSAACGVSLTQGYSCGASTPMRVCTANGVDPDYPANTCGWENCGLDTTTTNHYFGGCAGQQYAGTLCCPD